MSPPSHRRDESLWTQFENAYFDDDEFAAFGSYLSTGHSTPARFLGFRANEYRLILTDSAEPASPATIC